MKILLIFMVSVAVVALIVFTIIRNNRDRKKFERQLENDSPTIRHGETDIEIEDTK